VHDPVMKERKSRRSARVSSAMTERKSRTGRESIVKPWSAFAEVVRAEGRTKVSGGRSDERRDKKRTLDRPVFLDGGGEHDELGGSEGLEVANGEDCGENESASYDR
jgi:hypothetical protein